jgi:ERCC4-related helicase
MLGLKPSTTAENEPLEATDYQSQYWAHQLLLQNASDSVENLTRSISNSRVDLNPHQVDAALFAFRSPLSKGVILADEVGLGKTIEAGIVILQKWAEKKKRILLILPATLRTQWQQELKDKFFLPSVVLEAKSYNAFKKGGNDNPFQQNAIVICSYQFAAKRKAELSRVNWDLVVLDEAHRLRNVYKTSNKMAKTLREALVPYTKLLLTATPLQNSLLELYGLVSVIDDHVFGDQPSFRGQFVNIGDEDARNNELRGRLKLVCTRTLRKQVLEYVRYTKRIAQVYEFYPGDEEHQLYEAVSDYLQREVLYALPVSQRHLMTLVIRKLLASSTHAISQTLQRLIKRLEDQTDDISIDLDDFETLGEVAEEWDEDDGDKESSPVDQTLLRDELSKLREYAALAEKIKHNAKGDALLNILGSAMDSAVGLGGQRKAVIFTESRRTQQYLYDLLSQNGHAGEIVMLNGSNTDERSKEVLADWQKRHKGSERVTGLKSVDMKAALVEDFKDRSSILIATEAAAEGVNLQFCSLIINYDLPWNPQRIEQRIGRCHRYGQKCDVVVVNFLNKRNAADQRVYQLLAEKFKLFDGVFGSSDEVLGVLESGVDIEKRIAEVYQRCRKADDIKEAFDKLQGELDTQIQSRLAQAQKAIIDNFDEDVAARLKLHEENTNRSMSDRERWLYRLTGHELGKEAAFDKAEPRFEYKGSLSRQGFYNFKWPEADIRGDVFYRMDHPLAQAAIAQSTSRKLEPATLTFNYGAYDGRISALEPYIGKEGWLLLSKLDIQSFDKEEFLLVAAMTTTGITLDEDMAQKLLNIPATIGSMEGDFPHDALDSITDQLRQTRLAQADVRNARFFEEEVTKLDRWSEDLKNGLETEIKELDKEIRELKKESAKAAALTDKLEMQKKIRSLESRRKEKRQKLYEDQDLIDGQRDTMIARVEQQLQLKQDIQPVFAIKWRLVR